MADRPISRKKNVTEGGAGVHKRGEGLGTGPVGSGHVPSGGSMNSSSGGNVTRGGGRSPIMFIVVAAIILFVVFGGLFGDDDSSDYVADTPQTQVQQPASTQSSSGGSLLDLLLGGGDAYSGGQAAEWSREANTGVLDTSVASTARDKRTVIRGNGQDTVTIMVYMCGTDLESRSAMASKDIQEMLAAGVGDKVNLIIYTGGCKKWQNNIISNSVNQIYQVKGSNLVCLESDMGKAAMTAPDTLTDFIKYGASNFPADRYELIMWDHGGGSISGYGYDEKYASSGSMNLSGINKALKASGVEFDFVGFDACLMATVETALVVANYSDYMIASEETEPGIGWYYTDWLKALNANTSMPTTDIGKNIIDTFTSACAQAAQGQKTTLSLIDLAELQATVPAELASFSKDTSDLIANNEYKTVASARGNTREFATSNKLDQVDLIDFAGRIGSDEGKALADALLGCVKYNRTGSNMTNAYGLSIYFPYKKTSKVDSMVDTYAAIGMDSDYTKCIQSFASMEVAGQVAAGGSSSAAGSLFGDMSGSGSTESSLDSAAMIGQLLTSFMGSDFSSIAGLTSSNTSFLGKGLDIDAASEYIASNHIDPSYFIWTADEVGDSVISMPEDQWALISDVELNAFFDDGEGYVDLGLDNVFEFDDQGNLLAPTDRTWLSIEGQPVAYYHIDTQGTQDDYIITGRVPCYLNGVRCDLIVVFTSDNEDGYIAGARFDYVEGETDTIAKNMTELSKGDKIDFVCDYYDYDKNFSDSYYLGDQLTVDKDMKDMLISNTDVGDGTVLMTYRFVDIYGREYWTAPLKY